jgi:DNA invertase Pin-like site-specific DNA recombinase
VTAVSAGGGIRSRGFRCAIYTRKSTEEGLDQAFNSLDAQREACAAYIKSQVHEGWTLVSGNYDDGGYSGGTMERPGLQKLLTDIGRGQIDIVIVYKIDRLTRSLADFAKIVERLDARGASFVSVTQAFNTTTSMGRLTLNVLLSFAQFEREVGAERVRDKIAASKKKGIWMGGSPPLGYDVGDRKLIINPEEACSIRFMFSQYLELRSIGKLRAEIEAAGIRKKAYVSGTGRQVGGAPWYVGPLRYLLRNRIYVGEVVHKGNIWPGEHEAIIDRPLFDAVQAALDKSRGEKRQRIIRRSPGLLVGLVYDDAGNAMSPQASVKAGGQRHVYYVSQAILQRRSIKGSLPRVPAARLEPLVIDVVRRIEAAFSTRRPQHAGGHSRTQPYSLASDAPDLDPVRSIIRSRIRRVVIGRDCVILQINDNANYDDADSSDSHARTDDTEVDASCEAITSTLPGATVESAEHGWTISLPVSLARASTATSLAAGSSAAWLHEKARHDPSLLKALATAHRWLRSIEIGEVKTVEALGASDNLTRNSARQILRLAFLAPDLQRAILDGRQPPSLTVGSILTMDIPMVWADQRRLLRTTEA